MKKELQRKLKRRNCNCKISKYLRLVQHPLAAFFLTNKIVGSFHLQDDLGGVQGEVKS